MMNPTVPSCPWGTLKDVKVLVRRLGPNFSKNLSDRFRAPVARHYGKTFWTHIGSKYTPDQAGVYRGTITEGIDNGEMRIGLFFVTLMTLELNWDKIPLLPLREEIGFACYSSAIEFAQHQYHAFSQQAIPETERKAWPQGKQISPIDFYRLLYLYKEEEWFEDQALERRSKNKHDVLNSRIRRQTVAVRVLSQADCRARANPSVTSQTSIVLARSSEPDSDRIYLEQLQASWGTGWVIAISQLKYHWPA